MTDLLSLAERELADARLELARARQAYRHYFTKEHWHKFDAAAARHKAALRAIAAQSEVVGSPYQCHRCLSVAALNEGSWCRECAEQVLSRDSTSASARRVLSEFAAQSEVLK